MTLFHNVAQMVALLFFSGGFLAGIAARTAEPMPLELYKQILFSAVGTVAEGSSAVTETVWQAHAESNWARAKGLLSAENKLYPFIVCDQDTTSDSTAEGTTSPERRRAMFVQALGLDPNTFGDDVNKYFVTIYNVKQATCVLASLNATVAETLPWIVQPLSFLMKINAGNLEFTAADVTTGVMQYAVFFCPGVDYLNRQWALDALQTLVPLIPQLIQVDEAKPFAAQLSALQQVLQTEPTFCDSLLIDNVKADDAGEYVILSFDLGGGNNETTTNGTTISGGTVYEDAKTCFTLLSFALAFAPEICFMERRVPFETSNENAAWIHQSGQPDYVPFFDNGITGKGQIVAVSDTGLDLQSCYFRNGNDKPADFDYGTSFDLSQRKVVQYVEYVNRGEVRDGHGSHVAGTIAGHKAVDGINESAGYVDGVAKDAKLAFFDIGKDDEMGSLSVPGARTLFNPGKSAGARIHSGSWGSLSDFYTNTDRDFDKYLYENEDFLVIMAAGNDGPNDGTVRSPGLAKNVLTVGATNSAEEDVKRKQPEVDVLADFSSRGPSKDDRIKLDVVAAGSYVLSVGSRNEPSCDPDSEDGLPGPGEHTSADWVGILSLQGTSMATPVVSGHGALVRQYFLEGWYGNGTKGSAESKDISGTLLKAILINGAQPLGGYGLNEVDSKQGFGRISLIDSVPLAGANDLLASYKDKEVITKGQIKSYQFNLPESDTTCDDAEMSITLVWADPPGYFGCQRCMLNDLDLFISQTTADGTQQAHYPNGRTESKDAVNNVERVRFKVTPGDSFVATVTAAHLENEAQTYSLATVYGCLNHRKRGGHSAATTASTAMGFSFAAVMMTMVTLWQMAC